MTKFVSKLTETVQFCISVAEKKSDNNWNLACGRKESPGSSCAQFKQTKELKLYMQKKKNNNFALSVKLAKSWWVLNFLSQRKQSKICGIANKNPSLPDWSFWQTCQNCNWFVQRNNAATVCFKLHISFQTLKKNFWQNCILFLQAYL